MCGQALSVFTPILGMTVNVLIQVASFRIKGRLSLIHTIFIGFFWGLITMSVIDMITLSYNKCSLIYFIAIFITNIIIYGSLGYCYFHFINLGETARRIRLLREIYDSDVGLTTSELLKLYNAKEVLSYRIARLLKNKQIVLQDDRYLTGNPTILWIAKIIIFIKFVVLGKRSEFD